MAATTTTTTTTTKQQKPPRSICFSFAAYSKTLIDHLHNNSDVLIAPGLTDAEITSIQSIFHFTFPPDLRSILQQGLPIGPGFPNWRSSSAQQLQILTSLPILGISKEVSRHGFWFGPWGDRPDNNDDAVELTKRFLKAAPVLVPIYRHCYISSAPCAAGNPVFFVNGGDVKLWSYDVVEFFQQTEFSGVDVGVLKRRPMSLSNLFSSPVWAATEARRIEFWTELVELKEREAEARGNTRVWWREMGALGGCMDEVCWRLREGGWKEEEVREMMNINGGDEKRSPSWSRATKDVKDKEALVWHVRLLSMRLLRAGWNTGDVVDSLGHLLDGYNQHDDHDHDHDHNQEDEIVIKRNDYDSSGDLSSCFDFDFRSYDLNQPEEEVVRDDEVKKPNLRKLMKMGVGSSPLIFTQFR